MPDRLRYYQAFLRSVVSSYSMRSTIVLSILVLVMALGTVIAAGNPFLSIEHRPSVIQAFPDIPKRPFVVKAYSVLLDWRNPFLKKTQLFSGASTITLQLTEASAEVVLDAAAMEIDSLSINGVAQPNIPQPQNDQLSVPLPASLQHTIGQDIVLKIYYHRTSTENVGIYFYPKGTQTGEQDRDGNPVFTTEDVLYTMSEPTDAHYWMPCVDDPAYKAESEISIIVPNDIVTVSNGTLLERFTFDATSMLWHWKSDRPIATYLMSATASNYIVWHEQRARVSDPADSIDLVYYAWPSDYNDTTTDHRGYNARLAFRNTGSVISWFEQHYGPYPFKKYAQVPVDPFYYGGMEHQTASTINRFWLHGDEQGMAHELAHQWFGDKTTCRTFKDIWLNEGFATFSEAMWGESWGGDEWYSRIIQSKANDYFNSDSHNPNDIPIYDPPADNVFNGATTYGKAACVIHMLRRLVHNDTLFFNALKDYTNAFAYSTATTDDFTQFMSARLGIDLTGYIDEWIYGFLHPQYDISWSQESNNTIDIHISQTQASRDHFTMPVSFFAYRPGRIDTITVQNTERDQDFTIAASVKYDSLQFDNDAIILNEHTLHHDPALEVGKGLSAGRQDLQAMVLSNRRLQCRLSVAVPQEVALELYTTLGERIAESHIAANEYITVIDTKTLASGIYILRAQTPQGTVLKKVLLLQ